MSEKERGHAFPREAERRRRGSEPTIQPHALNMPDMAALRELEEGGRLTRFVYKRPPQASIYKIRQETRQILLKRTTKTDQPVVELNEVREIRKGQISKDFQKWSSELLSYPADQSFIIFHGNEFVLKTFSVTAPNRADFNKWYDTIRYLVNDARAAPTTTVTVRWLKREFFRIENKNHMASFKDVKSWFSKIGLKPSTKFKDVYQEVESSGGDINFEQFSMLYHKVLSQPTILQEHLAPFVERFNMNLTGFQEFLKYEQREPFANDINKVSQHLTSYLDNSGPLQLTPRRFLDYLYSKHNQVCQLTERAIVTDDMTKPLSHYWISSSHNTYLTGDQITSESSCESYIRCLRSGCKCLELDCWDGDKEPIIYHGRTLTSKINFVDVLEAIKAHAWDVSDYPLILSIENHCSIAQQQKMAEGFKRIFGDMLLREPVPTSGDHLPSPQALKRKIILKNRKLKYRSEFRSIDDETSPDDISQNKLSGLLHLQDPVDLIWKPHFFVLTRGKILFTDERDVPDSGDEECEEEDDVLSNQLWFHNSSREQCLQILETYGPALGDGAFLVRPSVKNRGYTLSFWRQNVVNNCKVSTVMVDGVEKYSLIDLVRFDNLTDLVNYYQKRSLHCRDFTQVLGQPVTTKRSFDMKEWYHPSLERGAAINMLSQIPYDGAFLIRKRRNDREGNESYAISFRAEGHIKHCQITKDREGMFSVKGALFDSLEEIVDCYSKTPLYRKMKLRYPTNQNLIARIGSNAESDIYSGYYYIDPTDFHSQVYARALYDYTATSATELTFRKGDIISNINKSQEVDWWRGDHGTQKQAWFPAAYVEELETPPEDASSLGSMQKGDMNLKNCSVVTVKKAGERLPNRFRITSPEGKSLEVACSTENIAREWADAIRENVNQLSLKAVSDTQLKQVATKERLSIDLSDLIIYCQTADFDPKKRGPPEEMSSLPEATAEKHSNYKNAQLLNLYNQRQLSRVYPKGLRIDSSNYDPTPMWMAGSQLAAINFQTPDLPMQLNHGKFLANGGSGYVLKPKFMNKMNYDPYEQHNLVEVEPLSIAITILGARHLPMRGRDIPSTFVEINIHGCDYDSQYNRSSTCVKNTNGLNPVWLESCVFDIINPELALIRFAVLNSDIFGDASFLAQATYPVLSLRNGYRSVPLKNGYSEEIPLAALLIHIEIGNPNNDYQDVYMAIQNLQEEQHVLEENLERYKRTGNKGEVDRLSKHMESMKRNLEEKKAERYRRIQEKKKQMGANN